MLYVFVNIDLFPRSRMPASIEKFIKASCLSVNIDLGAPDAGSLPLLLMIMKLVFVLISIVCSVLSSA